MQRDLGTEYVFYDTRGERFHVLNETARGIFLLCDGTRTIEAIASEIARTYDVDPGTAMRDAREFVAGMLDRGLLTVEGDTLPQR